MSNFTKLIKSFILTIVVVFTISSITGCDENGINDPINQNDTNIVTYTNVDPEYWRFGLNDTTYMGVDLFKGKVTLSTSQYKDMVFIDYQNTYQDFYFRSGHMSEPGQNQGDNLIIPGSETRFYFRSDYRNVTQAMWDTMSVIPDTDDILEPEDFTSNNTGTWNSLNPGQPNKPVYFFYLKGKYDEGLTPNRVFGMMWVKAVRDMYNPEGVYVMLDIKLNTAGQNKFKEQSF